MIGNLFNFKPETKLAHEMAARIAKSVPADILATRRQVLSAKRITRALEEAYADAKDFQLHNDLGFIRRSILANRLRWALKERAFPNDFIAIAVEGLIVELSRKKPSPPRP